MPRVLTFVLLGLVSWQSFAASPLGLSRQDALAIAEKEIKAQGIELKRYKPSQFPQELSADRNEWTFYYQCTPDPIPPGCFFWVSVNRITGVAKFLPCE
jgi:hypothetical protein